MSATTSEYTTPPYLDEFNQSRTPTSTAKLPNHDDPVILRVPEGRLLTGQILGRAPRTEVLRRLTAGNSDGFLHQAGHAGPRPWALLANRAALADTQHEVHLSFVGAPDVQAGDRGRVDRQLHPMNSETGGLSDRGRGMCQALQCKPPCLGEQRLGPTSRAVSVVNVSVMPLARVKRLRRNRWSASRLVDRLSDG